MTDRNGLIAWHREMAELWKIEDSPESSNANLHTETADMLEEDAR